MRKKIWHSTSLSARNKAAKGSKFQDEFNSLLEKIEYQAARLGFDLTDDKVIARLIEVASSSMDDDSSNLGTEAVYAERFLSMAYVQSLRASDRGLDTDLVGTLCLGNWLVGVLGGMQGTERANSLCPACIIDGYKESIARSGGAGRAAKLKVLEAETIRLYKAGKWDSTPLAAQAIAPAIIALSAKEGPKLTASTTKPLEWIRAYLNNMGPA